MTKVEKLGQEREMTGGAVIQKVVTRWKLGDPAAEKADLAYWLSKTPEERIEAVEVLRRQVYGSPSRLQRIARVIQRPQR